MSERPERAVRTRRRLFIDLTPLRRSRDLRFLVLGAITCFGLVSWLPGALALLAVAGPGRRDLGGVPQHDHPAHGA